MTLLMPVPSYLDNSLESIVLFNLKITLALNGKYLQSVLSKVEKGKTILVIETEEVMAVDVLMDLVDLVATLIRMLTEQFSMVST